MSGTPPARSLQIIERIFARHRGTGVEEFEFERGEMDDAATELGIKALSNNGAAIYDWRFRTGLPTSIQSTAPDGKEWVIRLAGDGRYRFALAKHLDISPREGLSETKVPDATPGIIEMYALEDEQALLAKVRYNRLIDIFTGVTCYSLQNHLRTTVPDIGQVEMDEVYIGVDRRGVHYAFPLEAKAADEALGRVQIEQGYALCAAKFPDLICRPIGAQFMQDDLIALFEFERSGDDLAISSERHYRLVPPDSLSPEDLAAYRTRPE